MGGPALTAQYKAISRTVQVFREAVVLHDRGLLGEAEQRYEFVLRADGRHFDALYRLGLIRLQHARFEAAAGLFRKALKVDRRSADAELHLGVALTGAANHEKAIRHYRKALALKPDVPETHNNLGYSLQALGHIEQAIPHYEIALAIKPRYAEASNNLGTALAALGRHQDAIPYYEAAIAANPDHVEVHRNLGKSLGEIGRFPEASHHYEKLLVLRPDDIEARTALGNTLHRLDRPYEAISHYEQVLTTAPTYAEALNSLGNTLHQLGRSDQAATYFRRTLAIDSTDLKANHDLGIALVALGRFDEARAYLEKAIALAPRNAGCYGALARCKRFTAEDSHFAAMKQLAAEAGSLSEPEQTDLYFALSKAYADIGEQQQSFDHILTANALKRRQIEFDEAKSLQHFDQIRKVFTAKLLGDKAGLGDPSDLPVFIVGMPRSGTTLIEQILASHPKVFGAGELRELGTLAARIRGPEMYPSLVPTLSVDELRQLGASYVQAVRRKAPTATRISDKMPGNFALVGLIHLALPNARIIYARRDLRDVAFSVFSLNFAAGHDYAYDLAELGRYCRAYAQLMEHWQAILPQGAMLEVQYEELVADLEHHSRRIVAHCGLEWNEACLNFYETERSVRTLSATQVRRPIYQSSIGRWRQHEARLQPLLKELDSCLPPSGA